MAHDNFHSKLIKFQIAILSGNHFSSSTLQRVNAPGCPLSCYCSHYRDWPFLCCFCLWPQCYWSESLVMYERKNTRTFTRTHVHSMQKHLNPLLEQKREALPPNGQRESLHVMLIPICTHFRISKHKLLKYILD